jgi:hypothetical protein
MNAKTLIEAVIGIVIGLALFPVVQDSTTNANATGVTGTLLDLIPTIYVIVIVASAAAYVYFK